MARPHDRYFAACVSLLLVVLGLVLIREGIYAWTLFIVVPFAIGCAAVWVKPRATGLGAAGLGALAATAAAFSLLLLGTSTLLDVSSKLVANLVRISSLPLMRPLRKSVLSLIHTVKGQ